MKPSQKRRLAGLLRDALERSEKFRSSDEEKAALAAYVRLTNYAYLLERKCLLEGDALWNPIREVRRVFEEQSEYRSEVRKVRASGSFSLCMRIKSADELAWDREVAADRLAQAAYKRACVERERERERTEEPKP